MRPTIRVTNVSKRYKIGRGLPSLRQLLLRERSAQRYHWAVKNLSFELNAGDALGIIGPNGAGKTTILKLLSNVTTPTEGEIDINGRFSALIELGAGFHPDLTGRENVYLNGAILGMTRGETDARFDEIVDFSGVEAYIDTPVKRYSSGMYARLGFAIAAHVDPEILLVDEVLAVGDTAFRMKCYSRMDYLRSRGTTLIFVSHNMEAVRRVCDRAIVMYQGESVFEGSAADAIVAYSDVVRKAARARSDVAPVDGGLSQRIMTFDAEIKNVTLQNGSKQPTTVLSSGMPASVVIDIEFHKKVHNPIFSLTIRTPDGRRVYDTTTRWQDIQTPVFSQGECCHVEFNFDRVSLLDGEYELGVDVGAANLSHYYDRLERALGFWVKSANGAKGLVDLDAQISFSKVAFAEQQL